MKLRFLVVTILALAALMSIVAHAAPVTYYVDSVAGSDSNNGTSTSTPWKTLAKVSSVTFAAGDSILLKCGSTWQESQPLTCNGSGSSGAPITVSSYGSGAQPRIIGNANTAVKVLNISYWNFNNLDISQVGLTPLLIDAQSGKNKDQEFDFDGAAKFVFDLRALNGTTSYINITNCKIHDGHDTGLWICAGYYQLGDGVTGNVNHVNVDNCEFYGNNFAGINATCQYTKTVTYTTTYLTVSNCYFHDMGGDGVVFGPVQHGLITNCHATRTGIFRNARLGIWEWDSNDIVIQYCESDHNVAPFYTSQTRDGGGFDEDLGTEDCVIQYCYSHHNTGEGYLIMTWPIGYGFTRGKSHNQTMRYCISEHDATKNGGGIENFGASDAWMYNNVVYYIPERSLGSDMAEGEGGCLCSDKWGKSGTPVMRSYNNIFVCDKTKSVNQSAVSYLVRHVAGTLTTDYNCYYKVEGGFLAFAGSDVTTWAAWQSGGRDTHGKNVNPMFTGAWDCGVATGYQLQSGSPCINAGTTVTGSPRGMGSNDFFGRPIPNGAYDIGIYEF